MNLGSTCRGARDAECGCPHGQREEWSPRPTSRVRPRARSGGRPAAAEIRRRIGTLVGALLLGERVPAIEGPVLGVGNGRGGIRAITGGGPGSWVVHGRFPRWKVASCGVRRGSVPLGCSWRPNVGQESRSV